MKNTLRIILLPLLLLFALPLTIPSTASAAGEVASASLDLTPRGPTFYNNAQVPANWGMNFEITSEEPAVLPTTNAALQMPAQNQMTFNPPANMPVCPDNKIGPETNNSAPVETITARCPNSVLGNGTATFLMAGNNSNPGSVLAGQVIVFNGGLVDGKPKLKYWAYSYDTGVGIYTQSTLAPDGSMDIFFPQLSFDSAVVRLDVDIPSTTKSVYLPNQDTYVTLPGGKAPSYVKAQCVNSTFPFSAEFTLSKRTTGGTPYGETKIINIENNSSCTGATGISKLSSLQIAGKSSVKPGNNTYKVTVRNSGVVNAQGVTLAVSGKGVSKRVAVGTVAGLGSKTVNVPLNFTKKGRIKVTFKASSSNAGSVSSSKTITVS